MGMNSVEMMQLNINTVEMTVLRCMNCVQLTSLSCVESIELKLLRHVTGVKRVHLGLK